ncbi:MAG: bifunctional diaminohydroxyphosphoribosylaminopyrimidine deaminase/5-amino-6-(5-phosphoribosylamino)uracil reductase RibD [Candidatus Aminicenantales bacterium]
MIELKDISYMEMAYALAAKAKGWASPNPYVGAVIVKRGVIVGYGYHERAGKPHAEALAFQRAGSQAHNSTAYLTLEPCVHWGRTPPCVDTILQAKPKKIFISALDPNPMVHSKGIKKLKQAGLEVNLGLLQEKNIRLNQTYIKYITKGIPYVAAKMAVSLDGKIATKKYSSQWISSAKTREYVHLLRGEFEALLIGINTLLQDDARLTVRHPLWGEKKLLRVIIDSHLRFPLKAKIISTLHKGKIIVFTLPQSSPAKAEALQRRGIEVIPLKSATSRVDLKKVLRWLGSHQVSSLLVEGGSRILTSFFEKRLIDKIYIAISPKLIGGKTAPSILGGKGVNYIKNSLKLKDTEIFQIDEDLIVKGYF